MLLHADMPHVEQPDDDVEDPVPEEDRVRNFWAWLNWGRVVSKAKRLAFKKKLWHNLGMLLKVMKQQGRLAA